MKIITDINFPVRGWLNQPFTLLDRKRDKLFLITAIGLFGFLFMYLYNPFNITKWFAGGDWENSIIFFQFSLIAVFTLSIMEFGVRPLLGLNSLTHLSFIFFVICELMLFSSIMFFSYEFITSLPTQGIYDFIDIFRYSALILIIPYSATLFYFNYRQVVSAIPDYGNHLIQIKDENDKLQLAVDQDQLTTIVATDNYVTVYYQKEARQSKELIRTSLKKLESELRNTTVIRCSRSTMINVKNIATFKTVNRQLVLEMKNMPEVRVNVSRNYKTNVLSILTHQTNSDQS
ncbi:LytTR family DNA-binding domain-containing protein [Reichenbachiella sp. MALMAid0571]|uniref:LytTR family DNA-binding domain-containing protein n=1 Tax=Reichenbachiella sp. MALMAid0571 TaxID=3143939 RepID=UPI0032DFA059